MASTCACPEAAQGGTSGVVEMFPQGMIPGASLGHVATQEEDVEAAGQRSSSPVVSWHGGEVLRVPDWERCHKPEGHLGCPWGHAERWEGWRALGRAAGGPF